MPCKVLPDDSRWINAIICNRVRTEHQVFSLSKRAGLLCDWADCDKPLCRGCVVRMGHTSLTAALASLRLSGA